MAVRPANIKGMGRQILPRRTKSRRCCLAGSSSVTAAPNTLFAAMSPLTTLRLESRHGGSPWSRTLRSPEGGDNLFLASIVAVRPDTGEYVWHYQTVPGDTWDYTAVQQPGAVSSLKGCARAWVSRGRDCTASPKVLRVLQKFFRQSLS
jgi:hypothetical protein